jgi:hypothetical protein
MGDAASHALHCTHLVDEPQQARLIVREAGRLLVRANVIDANRLAREQRAHDALPKHGGAGEDEVGLALLGRRHCVQWVTF